MEVSRKPDPQVADGTDQVPRLDAVLRSRPGWGIRFDGQRDQFVVFRGDSDDGDGERIASSKLRDVLDALECEAQPQDGYAWVASGAHTNRTARLNCPSDYPAEALCAGCGEVIRAEQPDGGWHHTGRRPGDPR